MGKEYKKKMTKLKRKGNDLPSDKEPEFGKKTRSSTRLRSIATSDKGKQMASKEVKGHECANNNAQVAHKATRVTQRGKSGAQPQELVTAAEINPVIQDRGPKIAMPAQTVDSNMSKPSPNMGEVGRPKVSRKGGTLNKGAKDNVLPGPSGYIPPCNGKRGDQEFLPDGIMLDLSPSDEELYQSSSSSEGSLDSSGSDSDTNSGDESGTSDDDIEDDHAPFTYSSEDSSSENKKEKIRNIRRNLWHGNPR